MKQKIVPYLKKVFSGINHPMMIAAIVIAFGMWYLNKLGHTYTTTIVLPVTIVNSAESPVGVLWNENNVECRVEGNGYELLKYRWSPRRHRLEIDLRRIDLRPAGENRLSEVTHTSLFNAVQEQLKEIRLLSILTPRIEIATAPFNTKTVPVRSRIEVDFRNQYMPIGPVRFDPDSIEVKSLEFLLDTLQAVYTKHREFSGVNGSLSGRIELEPIADVVYPVGEATFGLTVEEYTEIDLQLPLSLHNAPEGRLPVILPGQVSVRLNVARSRYASASSGEIRAYIDYDDRATNVGKQFKVYVPVPEGIVVKEVSPLYVELIFEEQP
ncbi:hypothetical protein LJB87_00090 [Alistipes sp. OttesenSCG-928-L06]|nr:hypothetical protein [Alistipes sp. OttesenSCG-928-L06]